MSDKQAAVQSASDSASDFAIMKKKHLSSFLARQGTLISSMYFHVFFDKLSNKLLWLFVCLFFFFPMKLHFLVF